MISVMGAAALNASPAESTPLSASWQLPASVVAFWDFQNATEVQPGVFEWPDRLLGGRAVLQPHNVSFPPTHITDDGVFGPVSVEFQRGQRLAAERSTVPEVTYISGTDATVTVIAWIKLHQPLSGGSYVGGVWEEYDAARQFALFLDGTGGCPENDGVVAHISAEGGPSPGQQYCRSRACGATTLQPNAWHCIANVYNGSAILAYVNGTLDVGSNISGAGASAAAAGDGGSSVRRGRGGGDGTNYPNNPFLYPNPPAFPNGGIYTPPYGTGAPLALGANFIHPGGGTGNATMGNHFEGRVGGFAVANEALSAEEVAAVCGAARWWSA
jgi:hypothetical protein